MALSIPLHTKPDILIVSRSPYQNGTRFVRRTIYDRTSSCHKHFTAVSALMYLHRNRLWRFPIWWLNFRDPGSIFPDGILEIVLYRGSFVFILSWVLETIQYYCIKSRIIDLTLALLPTYIIRQYYKRCKLLWKAEICVESVISRIRLIFFPIRLC